MEPMTKYYPLLLLLLVSFYSLGAEAADVRVCSQPELRSALNSAQPGDDIVLCDGEWRDLQLSFNARGTQSRPITLRADTPGQAVVTGRSDILVSGEYVVIKGLRFQDGFPEQSAVRFRTSSSNVCNNCRLTESSFVNYAPAEGSPEFDTYQFYVRLHGRNNRVDHNYFVGKHGMGQVIASEISSAGPEGHRIDHNYFGHRRPHPSGNHGEAIKIGEHTTEFMQSGTVVENNYFHRSNGEFEIISVKGSGITIRRNTFDRCEGVVSLRHGNGSWIDANTILGHRDSSNKVSGIRVLGEDHVVTNNYISGIKVGSSDARGGINVGSGESSYREGGRVAARNILIAFNTIVDSDRSFSIENVNPVKASDITFANNIVSSSHGPLVASDEPVSGVRFVSNLVHGGTVGASSSGLIQQDPLLVLSGGIHRLASNSPAIDQANPSYVPDGQFIDAERQVRSGLFDIGADEYNNGSGPGATKMCDTGPPSYQPDPSFNCATSAQPPTSAPPMPPELLSAQ